MRVGRLSRGEQGGEFGTAPRECRVTRQQIAEHARRDRAFGLEREPVRRALHAVDEVLDVQRVSQERDVRLQPSMFVEMAFCGTDENAQFAVVDHMEGQEIKLKRDASGEHHYIPLSWAKRVVDGKIQVDRPANEVTAQWTTTPNARRAGAGTA